MPGPSIVEAYNQARQGSPPRRPADANNVNAAQAMQRVRAAGTRPAAGAPAMLPARTVTDTIGGPAMTGGGFRPVGGGGPRSALLNAITELGARRVPTRFYDQLGIAAGTPRPMVADAFPNARRFQAPPPAAPGPRLNYDPNGPRGSALGPMPMQWLDGNGVPLPNTGPPGPDLQRAMDAMLADMGGSDPASDAMWRRIFGGLSGGPATTIEPIDYTVGGMFPGPPTRTAGSYLGGGIAGPGGPSAYFGSGGNQYVGPGAALSPLRPVPPPSALLAALGGIGGY